MAKLCCVCSDSKESADNRLFRCGGQGCGIVVHQACYGIVNIPTGLWFCRKCESQERAARVKCELCPRKDGALKRTDTGSWAHVVCALYIPEVTFGNLRTMEPIVTTKLPKERFSKSCYICEELGQENQSSTGACMSCHKSNCRLAFHVTCAQKEQLLVEEEDPRDSRNIIYCGYCNTHYKRMIKQKLKQQNLRKQGPIGAAVESIGGGGGGPGAGLQSHSLPDLATSLDHQTFSSSPHLPPPPPPHHHHQVATTTSSISGSLHIKSSSSSLKSKEFDKLHKRTSTEVGSVPSVKRKYRRRKLSSSNESSASEAPSSTSETLTVQNLQPNSPSHVVPAHSPTVTVSKKVTALEERETEPPSNILDCGNLDLLALVTQNVDQVDRLTGVEAPQQEGLGSLSPSAMETYIQESNVSVETVVEPTETVVKEHSKRGGKTGSGGGRKRKSTSSSAASQRAPAAATNSSNSTQLGPPLSLQELLERQWEQTAQFILDQAGRQNNAGIMLAHLHELQSENRTMQARIMELASQREFFIATNARLRQTLTEGGINKVLNGIQLLSSDGGQSLLSTGHEPSNSDRERIDSNSHPAASMETELPTSNIPMSTHSSARMNSHLHHQSAITTSTVGHHHHHQVLHGGVLDQFQRHNYPPSSYPQPPVPSYSLTNNPVRNVNGSNRHVGITPPVLPQEVTHVTNSVQGPITAYTGFPNITRVTSPTLPHRHST